MGNSKHKLLLTLLMGLSVSLVGCANTHENTGDPQNTQQAYASSKVINTTDTQVTKLATTDYQSGSNPIVEINHNKATLNPDSWKDNHIDYQQLDKLNRTSGTTTAYLQSSNTVSSNLRSEQTIQPTGWHQKFVNNQAILNRGHLIAYSLSKGINTNGQADSSVVTGDQNNLRNLFTQTAFSNQKLQTIYETKVRDALKANKKVIYAAHPIFEGNDKLAKGIQLQAISTDKSLDFNVFIYNVQPGVKFNYFDGTSKIDNNLTVPTPSNSPTFNNDGASATTQNLSHKTSHTGLKDAAGAYAGYRVAKHFTKDSDTRHKFLKRAAGAYAGYRVAKHFTHNG